MKISLIQNSIAWLQPSANYSSAEGYIAQCKGFSLVVLSEMFATGFSMKPERSSEGWRETLEWMRRMACKYDLAVAGSVAVECDGQYFNRLYVVRPDGGVEHYDKRHLFSFAGEHDHYQSGDRRVVVEIDGVRILLLICYDLRFPVACRNLGGDYDVAVCVANWPQPRRFAWDTLLRARAIENVAYYCGVNIVGDDPMNHYSGGTAAVDFLGDTVSKVADERCDIASVVLDLEALQRFRAKFPVLDDADRFEMIK